MPVPMFNRPYYLSNDMVVTMSEISSKIVKTAAPEIDERYIPLAVDMNIYKPLPENEYAHLKSPGRTLFFWNNRNAKRKMSGSIVWWFKEFLDKVGQDKAKLIMHTEPKDPNGQDLIVLAERVGLTPEQFSISTGRITQQELAKFYNAADCIINISDAEGVGMGTLESLACETPIIVNMTGGLQEQVTDGTNWFGIGIQSASKAVIGSQEVPYIYEDRVSKEDFIAALEKMHNTSPEDRKKLGQAGRKYMEEKYSLEKYKERWEETLEYFFNKFGDRNSRKSPPTYTVKEF
jgi:glycosyltransferase involved in cell wall biosynthesis